MRLLLDVKRSVKFYNEKVLLVRIICAVIQAIRPRLHCVR